MIKIDMAYLDRDGFKKVKEELQLRKFMKFDDNKLMYSLIPQEAIDALAEVLTYGAKKYAPDNWKKCENPMKYEDALHRHIAAYRKGEAIDDESGLPHLYHALCNIAFLIYFDEKAMQDDIEKL